MKWYVETGTEVIVKTVTTEIQMTETGAVRHAPLRLVNLKHSWSVVIFFQPEHDLTYNNPPLNAMPYGTRALNIVMMADSMTGTVAHPHAKLKQDMHVQVEMRLHLTHAQISAEMVSYTALSTLLHTVTTATPEAETDAPQAAR